MCVNRFVVFFSLQPVKYLVALCLMRMAAAHLVEEAARDADMGPAGV